MAHELAPVTHDPHARKQVVSDGILRSGLSRRGMLKAMGLVGGAAALASGGAAAWATGRPGPGAGHYILPEGFKGDISDLHHVVILMQENRSLDHYFGQMPGVRGFADKQTLIFQDGTTVFEQRSPGYSQTFPPYPATDSWGDSHAFYTADNGKWDTWVPDKGYSCMGYYDEQVLPFYYSLASQYTVGDMYFCSVHGPTDCNRKYLWSGMSNGETTDADEFTYDRTWLTVPEQLQEVGIDWRLYSDNSGSGQTGYLSEWIGDYGDNELKMFAAYNPAGLAADDPKLAPGTGLIWRANAQYYANTGVPNNSGNLSRLLAPFYDACQPGTQYPLPAVSWLVAPYNWCEHPNATVGYGELYTQYVINALQSNPDIWNHTLLIINYDENDGKFDHVIPPRPEPGTVGEWTNNSGLGSLVSNGGYPIGMGPRVPLMLVSPWTRGGYVATETFDHTSVVRFLEVWAASMGKPFTCPNITAWRRSVAGDLTSAIDFAHPVVGPATFNNSSTSPVTVYGDRLIPRPLSYTPHATLSEDRTTGVVTATMTLEGGPDGKAVVYAVFPDAYQEFSNTPVTVAAANPRTYTWDTTQTGGNYAFSLYSQDGFVRRFAGQVIPAGQTDIGIPRVAVTPVKGEQATLTFTLHNDGDTTLRYVLTANDYVGGTQTIFVEGGQSAAVQWPTELGYYDVILTANTGNGWTQRYAGRVATI